MKWHLRPWELSDVPSIALYANDPAIAAQPAEYFSLSLHAKGRGSIYRRLYGRG